MFVKVLSSRQEAAMKLVVPVSQEEWRHLQEPSGCSVSLYVCQLQLIALGAGTERALLERIPVAAHHLG